MTMNLLAAAMPVAGLKNVENAEKRLVEAARGGDEGAFTELVRRHQQRVFRLAGRFFRQREEVEDIAQDTFLTAWSKLSSYRAEAPFEHWLTRVCLNTCYGRFRGSKRMARSTAEVPVADLEATLAGRTPDPAAKVEVEGLLATLPPADRFVLLLLYGEGWSVAEIAERIGWSRSNVKVRAYRARKKLRRLLEEDL